MTVKEFLIQQYNKPITKDELFNELCSQFAMYEKSPREFFADNSSGYSGYNGLSNFCDLGPERWYLSNDQVDVELLFEAFREEFHYDVREYDDGSYGARTGFRPVYRLAEFSIIETDNTIPEYAQIKIATTN